MNEPAVALTDWALSIECAVFAGLLLRVRPGDMRLRRWFALLFGSLAAASLLGGLVHGLFADPESLARRVLWCGTLLAIGTASAAVWVIGALLLLPPRAAHRMEIFAWAQLAALVGAMAFVTQRFWIAIVTYLPATLWLLVAFVREYARRRIPALAWGVVGMLVTFVAAAIQQLRVSVHPVYFDHNALYHLVQAIGLAGIFVGARVERKAC